MKGASNTGAAQGTRKTALTLAVALLLCLPSGMGLADSISAPRSSSAPHYSAPRMQANRGRVRAAGSAPQFRSQSRPQVWIAGLRYPQYPWRGWSAGWLSTCAQGMRRGLCVREFPVRVIQVEVSRLDISRFSLSGLNGVIRARVEQLWAARAYPGAGSAWCMRRRGISARGSMSTAMFPLRIRSECCATIPALAVCPRPSSSGWCSS